MRIAVPSTCLVLLGSPLLARVGPPLSPPRSLSAPVAAVVFLLQLLPFLAGVTPLPDDRKELIKTNV